MLMSGFQYRLLPLTLVGIFQYINYAYSFIPCCGDSETCKVPDYDPELDMSLEEIIKHWGYPAELHRVHTKDKYILTSFRIPHGRNVIETPTHPRPVVLFMHGLETTASCYLSNLPHQDGAYLYADAGLDVWLGNFRGNIYGMEHENMTYKNREFWKFCCDDMAHSDLPAIIDYILEQTLSEFLYYVGHSMGTTNAFALLSSDPKYNKKVRRMFALAPVTTAKHIQGSLKSSIYLMPFLHTKGPGPFWTHKQSLKSTINLVFKKKGHWKSCWGMRLLNNGQGPHEGQFNKSRLPIYLKDFPAGTSWRVLKQFGQRRLSGKFGKYKFYVRKKNVDVYGQQDPPMYDLSQIETPVTVYHGGVDYLATPQDVNEIIAQLKNVESFKLANYNHMAFLWGLNAAKDIFEPILHEIRRDFDTS